MLRHWKLWGTVESWQRLGVNRRIEIAPAGIVEDNSLGGGDMTYEEAMGLLRKLDTGVYLVRRPHWKILKAVSWYDPENGPSVLALDNYDGLTSGPFGPYKPTSEDLAATDWEAYSPPTDEQIAVYEADPNSLGISDFRYFEYTTSD